MNHLRCEECGEVHETREALEAHREVQHGTSASGESSAKTFSLGFEPVLERFPYRFLTGLLTGLAVAAVAVHLPGAVDGVDPVRVTVVSCGDCEYGRFVNVTDRMFHARFVEEPYNSSRGRRLVEKYNIRYVPGFIFDRSVSERENFSRITNSLVEFEDAYVVSDRGNRVAQRFTEGRELSQR